VDADSRMSLERTLTTALDYYSICSLGDDRFAVTTRDDEQPPVRIIDTQGNEGDFQLIKFPKRIHKFIIPYCAYNPVSKTLVWTDENIIHIVNTTSGTTTRVTDTRIQGTTGVAVGPDGYIYVSSFDTNSVVCISPHGKVDGTLSVGLNTYASAISVTDDGKKMVLISERELKLYKIIYKTH